MKNPLLDIINNHTDFLENGGALKVHLLDGYLTIVKDKEKKKNLIFFEPCDIKLDYKISDLLLLI